MHPLYTVFQKLALHDTLTLHPRTTGTDRLSVSGEESAPEDESNLIIRALDAVRSAGGDLPPMNVELTKRIPAGGGLGGGSSDAAAVLRYARSSGILIDRPYPELAAELGADVPFFLLEKSAALGTGIGDTLEPVPPLAASVLLAIPPFRVSTEDAYARVEPSNREPDEPERIRKTSPHRWIRLDLSNDFSDVLRDHHDRFGELESSLEDHAEAAGLTGSGSVLYGLYRNEASRDRALEHLKTLHPEVRWISTRLA